MYRQATQESCQDCARDGQVEDGIKGQEEVKVLLVAALRTGVKVLLLFGFCQASSNFSK